LPRGIRSRGSRSRVGPTPCPCTVARPMSRGGLARPPEDRQPEEDLP
jgi:hypothetical protein